MHGGRRKIAIFNQYLALSQKRYKIWQWWYISRSQHYSTSSNSKMVQDIIIIIISSFGIYGAAVVPDSWVGNTWQLLTLVLHEFLSNGLTPSRLHIVISFLTHADHVFLGLPRFLVPGTPNRVMELMQDRELQYTYNGRLIGTGMRSIKRPQYYHTDSQNYSTVVSHPTALANFYRT